MDAGTRESELVAFKFETKAWPKFGDEPQLVVITYNLQRVLTIQNDDPRDAHVAGTRGTGDWHVRASQLRKVVSF